MHKRILSVYSLVIWVLNLLLAAASFFCWSLGPSHIILFFAVLPQWSHMNAILKANRSHFLQNALRNCPGWVKTVTRFCYYYGLTVLVTGLLLLFRGRPSIVDGTYCLAHHGAVARECTKAEYLFLSAVESCLFPHGMLVFSSVSMAFFQKIPPENFAAEHLSLHKPG